jgi:hypothetical protein
VSRTTRGTDTDPTPVSTTSKADTWYPNACARTTNTWYPDTEACTANTRRTNTTTTNSHGWHENRMEVGYVEPAYRWRLHISDQVGDAATQKR